MSTDPSRAGACGSDPPGFPDRDLNKAPDDNIGDTTSIGQPSLPRPADAPTDQARYELIRSPKSFFKKGRFFATIWIEPAGQKPHSPPNPQSITTTALKERRFIVIRRKSSHCICLPVHTHTQRKRYFQPFTTPENHAPVVAEGKQPVYLSGEQQGQMRTPIHIKVESPDAKIDESARLDYSRVYTGEYNLGVRSIGRVITGGIAVLERGFGDVMRL